MVSEQYSPVYPCPVSVCVIRPRSVGLKTSDVFLCLPYWEINLSPKSSPAIWQPTVRPPALQKSLSGKLGSAMRDLLGNVRDERSSFRLGISRTYSRKVNDALWPGRGPGSVIFFGADLQSERKARCVVSDGRKPRSRRIRSGHSRSPFSFG